MLDAIAKGDAKAPAAFLDLVYNELRRLAASKLALEFGHFSLDSVRKIFHNGCRWK